jgi:nitrite reductase/ring-hydroxylating ferredoxin subunit
MLPKEQNELLTRTGPGTPMGELMRRYWIPALLSEEIPTRDGPPVRVRLLGEELVAFRDTSGRIGLVGEHCAHRGTSLFYGRNEECGLRCVYHGWKFDVDGNVLETPAEPTDSDFKTKLKHTAYPTREAAGMIYAYLGPREKMPLFPSYEWHQVPLNQTYVTKCLMECSYLQGLEGECDSSHLSLLHQTFTAGPARALWRLDSAPSYETEETDFGVRLIATRKAGPGRQYIRFSSFVMPVFGGVPAGRPPDELDGFEVHMYVPYNDTLSWRYDFGFRAIAPSPTKKSIGGSRSARLPAHPQCRESLSSGPRDAEKGQLHGHRRFSQPRRLRYGEHGADLRPQQGAPGRQRQGGDRAAKISVERGQDAARGQGSAAHRPRRGEKLFSAYRLLRVPAAGRSALARALRFSDADGRERKSGGLCAGGQGGVASGGKMKKKPQRVTASKSSTRRDEEDLKIAAKILEWEIGDIWDTSACACRKTTASPCRCSAAPKRKERKTGSCALIIP